MLISKLSEIMKQDKFLKFFHLIRNSNDHTKWINKIVYAVWYGTQVNVCEDNYVCWNVLSEFVKTLSHYLMVCLTKYYQCLQYNIFSTVDGTSRKTFCCSKPLEVHIFIALHFISRLNLFLDSDIGCEKILFYNYRDLPLPSQTTIVMKYSILWEAAH